MTRQLRSAPLVLVLFGSALGGRAAAQPAAQTGLATGQTLRLTVDEAVARGLATSHRVEELGARADVAAAVSDQRHSALLPRVSALGGYTRTNHVETFAVPAPGGQLRVIYPDVPDNIRSRVDAQWALYTGGRLEALERAARTETTASNQDLESLRNDLKAEVARAYWTLVSAIEGVRVIERSIGQVDAHLTDARNQFAAGLIPPNDVLTVEAQRARQQMLYVQATSNRDVAEAALVRLIGASLGTHIDPATPLLPAAAPTESIDALLQMARTRRPDRQALSERVTAATHRTDAALAGKRPTIGVGGGFDYARPNPKIFPRQAAWKDSWDASINVEWPLFDGGRTAAEVAEATAALRAAEARLAEFDSQLTLEIRQRLSEIEAGRAAVVAADAAIAAGEEAVRVVRERFSVGVATSTDVLDAEIIALQAALERTQALAVQQISAAGLLRATGR